MRVFLTAGALAVLVIFPAAAMADWADDFDTYADGTLLFDVGGWSGWDGDAAYAGTVSSAQARSGPHSIEIADAADAVRGFTGYTSGAWTFTAWQYIPTGLSAQTAFVMQNEYNHGGPYEWAIETHMDPALGIVWDELRDPGGASGGLPIAYDAWAEIRLEIDLDADTLDHYYNGELLSSGAWAVRGGPVEIANLDLFAWGASAVYYDDISLVPEPAACLLLALGAVVGLRRR